MIRSAGVTLLAILMSAVMAALAARGVFVAEHGLQRSSFDRKAGREMFQARCARCHSLGNGNAGIGPNLAQIGKLAAQRRPGQTSTEYLLESILRPAAFKAPGSSGEMPSNLMKSYDDDAIRNLAAFLSSLGAAVPDEQIRQLRIARPDVTDSRRPATREQILEGEALYRGKGGCAVCHPCYGGAEFEQIAPRLFQSGVRDADTLRRAITQPHDVVAPRYQLSNVQTSSGMIVSGLLISRSDTELQLLVNDNGSLKAVTIPLADVEQDDNGAPLVQRSTQSLMPVGYSGLLSTRELDAIVVFLQNAS